jgi:hemolysin-activating ACP:hemolysin acyltransferase
MAPEKITEKDYMEILGNAFWLSKKSKLHCKYYNVCGSFAFLVTLILVAYILALLGHDFLTSL